MTREEAVRLVSRALACIEAISAVAEASFLPERFVTLHHYIQEALVAKSAGAVDLANYYASLERVEIGFFFGRIAFFLLTALLFWNCGPRIGRFFLQDRKSPSPAS
jgi:hypothetical protein